MFFSYFIHKKKKKKKNFKYSNSLPPNCTNTSKHDKKHGRNQTDEGAQTERAERHGKISKDVQQRLEDEQRLGEEMGD